MEFGMVAEDKKIQIQSRIQTLSSQLDFLTAERAKLLGVKLRQQDYYRRANNLIDPMLLMVQSLLLQWLQRFDELVPLLIQNMNDRVESQFKGIDSIFVNYMRLLQLWRDIDKKSDAQVKSAQIGSFQELLTFMKDRHSSLQQTMFEDIYMQYDEALDKAMEGYIQNFRQVIKIFDAFQVKITEFHEILPPSVSQALFEFPNHVQELEDAIEVFRKELHNKGESTIYNAIKETKAIFSAILIKVDLQLKEKPVKSESDSNFIEYIETEYSRLDTIKASFFDSMINSVEEVANSMISAMNLQAEKFVHFVSDILEQFREYGQAENGLKSEDFKDLPGIEEKMEEIIKKLKVLDIELKKA